MFCHLVDLNINLLLYRISVHCGGCKCLVPMSATYCKPVRHGVNQLNLLLRSAGHHCGALNSYWVCQDSMYKFFELSEEILTPNGSPNQSTSTGRCEALHLQAQELCLGKGHKLHYTILLVVVTIQLGKGILLSSSSVTANISNGHGFIQTQGHVASPEPSGCMASPGPRCARLPPDPGPNLTRIQGHMASPGPGTQLHWDPGAHGLTRTQERVASPRPRGVWPHLDPGAHGLTRTRDLASPGPRGA
ncbi:hypothetical protein QTO34_018199 [Cnephaeus nilssonii]|uniref:Ribosomal protein L15 n=1 Tax=Cnephaeus nilssonii TaxID=3371016 RepID=A0AA40LNL4_CNENI|nr:hypothetical protein QTO34_018199 [Eptesicus nilssonii]